MEVHGLSRGDNMSVEKSPVTFIAVPSGTECDDCHMAYLTARGRLDAVNFLPTFRPYGTANPVHFSRISQSMDISALAETFRRLPHVSRTCGKLPINKESKTFNFQLSYE
jgi:hypothetical protein